MKAIKDKYGNPIDVDCIFPFIYKGKLVKKCVPLKKGSWCATKVNKKKEMVDYGFCGKKTKKQSTNNKPIINNANIKANNTNKKNTKKSNSLNKNNSVRKTIRVRKFDINSITPDIENNIKKLVIPESMEKYIRPVEDKLKLLIWENPTRKNFLNWFNESFKKYRVKTKTKSKLECKDDLCEAVPKKNAKDLFNHQKIVRDYHNLQSPYRGLILYHGLGVGKTGASIAIAEGFKTERKIVVMLMKSIKDNYVNQLKEHGDLYYRTDNHWEFVKTTTEEKRNVALKIGIPPSILKKYGGCFLIDFTKPSNYDSFSELKRERLNEQIDAMIYSKYDFKFYNGFTTKQLDDMEVNNYFDNKVVVVDEVHNIINGMASGGSMRSVRLNELFMKANNMKLVFLSGTPMKNTPFEIAKLYNVLRGNIELIELSIDSSMISGGKVNFKNLEKDLQNNELVDQVLLQTKNKIIKITRNPIGFVRTKDNKGLVKSERNNVTFEQFMEQIELYLINKGYKLKGFHTSKTTLFPEDEKEFLNRFYDPIKRCIIDKETFTRRILGLTSYYAAVDESLMPSIRTEKIKHIYMSDYMFDKYAEVRKLEIDRDKSSKKAKKKKGKDELSSLNSSYRAYSRMSCLFAWPEHNPRPYKGDGTDIELNEDDIQAIDNLNLEYQNKILKEKSLEKVNELKSELKLKINKLSKKDKDYERRLDEALRRLDSERDMLLAYDNGNKNKLVKYSSKYAEIIKNILSDKGPKKGLKFVYTELKKAEGIGIFSMVLRANGYSPLKVRQVDGEWVLKLVEGEEHMPKFAVWSGDEESDIILNIFNNNFDKLPENVRKDVLKISPTNKNAEVLEILMTTKQGAEGLNTKNVRQLHISEPYWNPVRIDQVKGRAIRAGSHLELPPKDRNVDIFLYISKATKEQIARNVTIMTDFEGMTSDEKLQELAEAKRGIMNDLLGIMRNSAIDCSINYADNVKAEPNIKCLHFGDVKDNHSYSYNPDLNLELKKAERESRVVTEAQKFKPIKVPMKNKDKGFLQFFRKDNLIYDFDEIQSGVKGRPVGEITVSSTGKNIIRLY